MKVVLSLCVAVVCVLGSWARAADLSLGPLILEPPSGLPEQAQRMLVRRTVDELAHAGFQVNPEGARGALRLSGVANATKGPDGASVTILWTLVNPAGGARRVEVNDLAPYQADAAWDAVDVDTLARLARTTALALEALETGAAMPEKARVGDTPAGNADSAQTPTSATRAHLAAITGAPGDGEAALARALAQTLVQFDVVLVPTPEPGAYIISAKVNVTKASTTEDRVEILWTVSNREGSVLAKVSQDNKVTSGSLSPHWGQTAVYASAGAAEGLLSAMGELGPVAPQARSKSRKGK